MDFLQNLTLLMIPHLSSTVFPYTIVFADSTAPSQIHLSTHWHLKHVQSFVHLQKNKNKKKSIQCFPLIQLLPIFYQYSFFSFSTVILLKRVVCICYHRLLAYHSLQVTMIWLLLPLPQVHLTNVNSSFISLPFIDICYRPFVHSFTHHTY